MEPIKNAVELDEYLLHGDPDFTPNPTYQDQLDSARRDAIAAAERRLGKPSRSVKHCVVDDWLRLGALSVIYNWATGKAKTCIHNPTMESPTPVISAAWMPDLIVCHGCSPQLVVDGDIDKRCDGCGHICEGPPDDGITPVTIIIGSLCYHAGACDSCYAKLP